MVSKMYPQTKDEKRNGCACAGQTGTAQKEAVPGLKYGNAGAKCGSSAAGAAFSASCKLGMPSDKGSSSNCQQRDVRNGVEIFSRLSVSDPKSLLRGGFEAGVISLTLCS